MNEYTHFENHNAAIDARDYATHDLARLDANSNAAGAAWVATFPASLQRFGLWWYWMNYTNYCNRQGLDSDATLRAWLEE